MHYQLQYDECNKAKRTTHTVYIINNMLFFVTEVLIAHNDDPLSNRSCAQILYYRFMVVTLKIPSKKKTIVLKYRESVSQWAK